MADHQSTRPTAELTTLDAFLDEEGIREEVTLHAVKRVLAMQLEQAMQERKLSKSAMARADGHEPRAAGADPRSGGV